MRKRTQAARGAGTLKVLVRQKAGRSSLTLYYIDPQTGREVTRTAETNDRRDAERAAARWEEELREYRGRENDGWKMFRDRFRDEHLEARATSTQLSYGTALNHYERLMNPQRVADVTPSTVSVFQSKLLAEKRPLSSIGNYLTHLRSALNWAESVGLIAKAPKIKLPRQPKRVFMRSRPITEAEYRKLNHQAKDLGDDAEAYRRLMELLWLSGLRLSEALRLSWSRQPILVQIDALPYPQIVFWAEGHKARRDETVPLTPELAAWLATTPVTERRGRVVKMPAYPQRRISETITALAASAEIVVNDAGKFAGPHDFRRAFGTRWAQRVLPMTLQKLMRHADIQTTLRYYIGLSSTDAGREIWAAATQPIDVGTGANPPVPENVPKTGSGRTKAG